MKELCPQTTITACEQAADEEMRIHEAEVAKREKQTNKGESMTAVSICLPNGNVHQFPKLTNRRLFKVLRTEGLLPAESVGKTSSEVLECGSVKVFYRTTELFISVEDSNTQENEMDSPMKLALFIQDKEELETYEKELAMFKKLSETGTVWDMVENSLMINGLPEHLEIDDNGHEIGADKKLNYAVQDVYMPTEKSEFYSSESNGDAKIGETGDAELMTQSYQETEYKKDAMDTVKELADNTNVFTRKNTISEETAMENTMKYMKMLEGVTTYEELTAARIEIFAKQNEFEYSRMFFFVKGGSKAIWTLYRAKKEEINKSQEVNMENDVKEVLAFITKLEGVKTFKELTAIRVAVFALPYSNGTKEVKGEFWAAYRVKKAELSQSQDELREASFKELAGLILKSSDESMLGAISQEIFNSSLPLAVKKVLWFKVSEKRETGETLINITKGLEFLNKAVEEQKAFYANKNKSA